MDDNYGTGNNTKIRGLMNQGYFNIPNVGNTFLLINKMLIRKDVGL